MLFMNLLKNYEKEINKCSKCGLCQSVCPIYKVTGNDCTVSRGKFAMLDGVIKGDLKLSKTINKYLDMCSKCGKCKDFCPSEIDVTKIIETAKAEYAKNDFLSQIIFFLESKIIFNNFLNIFNLFKRKDKIDTNTTITFFKSCADKVFPNNELAIKKILKYYDISLIEKDFDCCGVPFLSSGNLKRYEQAKSKNLKLLQNTILTDCASCEDTLKNYNSNAEIINILDFLIKNPKKFIFKNHLKVTFHKPCHLKNDESFNKIIENCENIEYIKMKDYDECCGFSGEFLIKNLKLSTQMMKLKAKNAIDTNPDIILTLCPACIIGLKTGLILNGKNIPVMNVVEFLSKADKIY